MRGGGRGGYFGGPPGGSRGGFGGRPREDDNEARDIAPMIIEAGGERG